MTIEQKPELNRYIDPSIPLTWAYRKWAMKLLFPLVIFLSMMAFLKVLLREMATNTSGRETLENAFGTLAAGFLSFSVIFSAAIEFGARMRHRSGRKLQILDNRIALTPGAKFVKWKRITKFQFRPVADSPDLTILEIFRRLPNSKYVRWAIVLDGPNQMRELKRQLESRKLEAHLEYEIEMLKTPIEMRPLPPVSLRGGLTWVGGMILLLSGMGMLFGWMSLSGFLPPSDPSHVIHSSSLLVRFVAAHFSSQEEYKQCLLTLGAGQTAAGIGLIIWGNRISKRSLPADHQDLQMTPF